MKYETRVTALVVLPVGQPTFSEMATTVEIADEAAGEFVEVKQRGRIDIGKNGLAGYPRRPAQQRNQRHE